jgi:hypothetical protein
MKTFTDNETVNFFTSCKNFELLPEKKFDHPTIKAEQLNMNFYSDAATYREYTKYTGYYFFLAHSFVSEKEVGLSKNESDKSNIIWELVREEIIKGSNFVVFSGWGDRLHGGHFQFEGYEIAFPKKLVTNILLSLMTNYSNNYPLENMMKIQGINWLKIDVNPTTGGRRLTVIDE